MFDADLDEVLRKTALFSQLSAEEREEVEAIGRVVRARTGSTLIKQGDEAGGMSVVVAGRVRIELELPDGRRETLATLARGDVFGELSLVDRFPRSASAIADSDARVFLINGTEFDRLRHGFRPAAYKILRGIGPVLCKRLRAVDRAIAERLMERRRETTEAANDEPVELSGAPARLASPQGTFDVKTVPPLMGTPAPPPLPPESRVVADPIEARLAEALAEPAAVEDELSADEVVELSDSGLILVEDEPAAPDSGELPDDDVAAEPEVPAAGNELAAVEDEPSAAEDGPDPPASEEIGAGATGGSAAAALEAALDEVVEAAAALDEVVETAVGAAPEARGAASDGGEPGDAGDASPEEER